MCSTLLHSVIVDPTLLGFTLLYSTRLCFHKQTPMTTPCFIVCFLVSGAMAKRRAEIEEEQELEEERMKNARLSVSNEGDGESKGRVESTGGDGDVEMKEERQGEVTEKVRKRSESRDPENGVREERSVQEERQAEGVETMEEEDGEID